MKTKYIPIQIIKRKKLITTGRYIAKSGNKIVEGAYVGTGIWLFKLNTKNLNKISIFSIKEIPVK